MRVAIVGAYRSGATTIAGVLHYLGIDLGSPFGNHAYESEELTGLLRRWWSEPRLTASLSSNVRRELLREWVVARERKSSHVGAKHPLLSLCTDDLANAWGSDTQFIWCQRPMEQCIDSLARMGWWKDCGRIQLKLATANEKFFQNHACHIVQFERTLFDPEGQVRRLVTDLDLSPTESQITNAIEWLKQGKSNPNRHFVGLSILNSTAAVDLRKSSNNVVRREPKIVATVLSGNSESIIGPAIESIVDWVDQVCLIDTGITDSTSEVVCKIAGEKFVKRSFPWCNDFAAARNAAFEIAADLGATWAVTVDSDERFIFSNLSGKDELLAKLESAKQVKAWMASARDGSYRKERFVRVPTHLRWGGRTHEALTGAGWKERELIPNCRFWEAPKSTAKYQHKVERDLQILLEETAEQPFNARWWYYLGQTYEGLKRPREAVEAFKKCVRLDGWADECGWACYTAARCLVSLGEFREAEELCALGLTRKPSCPELTWLAGWSCFQRGALTESIAWCKMTLAQQSNGGFVEATGFKHVPAWFEAPYDVLRYAYRQIGKTAEAEQYEKEFETAKAARQREFPNA